MNDNIQNISPIDGRYKSKVSDLNSSTSLGISLIALENNDLERAKLQFQ